MYVVVKFTGYLLLLQRGYLIPVQRSPELSTSAVQSMCTFLPYVHVVIQKGIDVFVFPCSYLKATKWKYTTPYPSGRLVACSLLLEKEFKKVPWPA